MFPLVANAAEGTESDQSGWKGEGELGYTTTSGNTDSENLNASLGVSRQAGSWKHAALIKSIRNKADDVTSADSLVLKARSEYQLGEKSYAFGQLRYEEDEFSGYDRQTSLAFGLGSRVLENERHFLDLSAGLGYRYLEQSDPGDETDEAILTASLDYQYKISETATFGEAILVESGDDNTHSESETSLKAKIDGNLATKISYLVKHNSDVPDGTDKTDKIVTVSLVYGF
ncbi:MAG: DUF481 domain-containing protein [Gammaproteobacteria bacterium]|nr:DUF481 domain-containing protein [Gammaproteobacteria bacterium]